VLKVFQTNYVSDRFDILTLAYSFVYSQPVETDGDRLTGSSARGILSDLT